MRTFIALNLSSEAKNELSRLQEELIKVDREVKWVKPENIHLTLKFLGNVEEAGLEEVKHILDGISSEEKPFEITLSALGAFPDLNRPRVLWVGLDKGSRETKKIASLLEAKLQKIGFPKEDRPFTAHLTLGRVKSGRNKPGLKEKAYSLRVLPKSSAINNITLFRSTLTPNGPVYASLHEAKFMGKRRI